MGMSTDFASRAAALWACPPDGIERFQAQRPTSKRVDLDGAKLKERGPYAWAQLGALASLAVEVGTVLANMNT